MRLNKVKKSIYIFICFALLSGWIGKVIDMLLTNQTDENSLGMLVWLIGPVVSVLGLKIVLSDSVKYLGLKFNIKNNVKIYIMSVILFPVILCIIYFIGKSCGVITSGKLIVLGFADGSSQRYCEQQALIIGYSMVFVCYFVKNIFEEISWRSFLTERLLLLKLNDWVIYFIATVVRCTWYIPYYLFFTKVDNPLKMILLNYVVFYVWTIMFTEIYIVSRSMWPCAIMHTSANSLILFSDIIVVQDKFNWALSFESGLVQLIICLAIGFELRKARIRRGLHKQQNTEEIYGAGVGESI